MSYPLGDRELILADVEMHFKAAEPYIASLLLFSPEIGAVLCTALADAWALLDRDQNRLAAYQYRKGLKQSW